MTVDQARECARRTLHKVLGTPAQPRIKGAEAVEDWARRLADASQGWPQHLHSYFTAAWRTLVAQEHPDLVVASQAAALALGDEFHRNYYEKRLGGFLGYEDVVAAVHRALAGTPKGTLSKRNVVDVIAASHPGFTVKERINFAQRLQRSGVVADNPEGLWLVLPHT